MNVDVATSIADCPLGDLPLSLSASHNGATGYLGWSLTVSVVGGSLQVRLALPAIMPDVKRTVRLPEGVIALEKVNAATSALLTDTDRRVWGEARSMH